MTTEQQKLTDILCAGVADMAIELSERQITQLVSYVLLMNKWNKAYNLTSVRDPEQMMVKHILDSLAVSPFIDGQKLIDVGTGPGLPGIPLAIMHPDKDFTLLDSLGKRVRFMKQVVYELALTNVNPIQSRVEAHMPQDPYDIVLSRAFASLKDMLHWCQHLVDFDGVFFALKGQRPDEEVSDLDDAFNITSITTLHVPHLEGERHLVKIQKCEGKA